MVGEVPRRGWGPLWYASAGRAAAPMGFWVGQPPEVPGAEEWFLGPRCQKCNFEKFGFFLASSLHTRVGDPVTHICGFDVGSMWIRCGYDVGTMWVRCRYDVGTMWVRCGYDVGTMWVFS